MKKILLLTKVMMKSSTNVFEGNRKGATSTMGWGTKIFIGIAIAFGAVSMAGLFGGLMYSIISQLKAFNQVQFAFYLYLSGAAVVAVMFSLIVTPSIYYFDEQMEDFLVLPITRMEYLSAKWIVNAYSTSLILLPFSIIFTIIYAWNTSITALTIPIILISTIIAPLLPISLVVLFIVLLFKTMPFIRNKNLFTYFITFIGLILGLGINFMTMSFKDNENLLPELIAGFQGEGNTLIQTISTAFPNIKYFSQALNQDSLLPLLIGIVITALVIYLTILFTKYNYLDSALSMKESGHKAKAISEDSFSKQTRVRSHRSALMKQDLRNILRTPIYASNYFLPILLVPLSLVFAFMGSGGEDFSFIAEIPDLTAELLSFFTFGEQFITIFFIFIVIGYITGSFSTVTSTAISREGTQMQNYLQMPINLKDVIDAKILLGAMITALFPILMVIGLQFIVQLPILLFIFALVFTMVGILCANISSILLDVIKPKLVWASEQEAVKQNLLSIIPMFVSFGIVGLALWQLLSNLSIMMLLPLPIIIMALSATAYLFISKKGIKILKNAVQAM